MPGEPVDPWFQRFLLFDLVERIFFRFKSAKPTVCRRATLKLKRRKFASRHAAVVFALVSWASTKEAGSERPTTEGTLKVLLQLGGKKVSFTMAASAVQLLNLINQPAEAEAKAEPGLCLRGILNGASSDIFSISARRIVNFV